MRRLTKRCRAVHKWCCQRGRTVSRTGANQTLVVRARNSTRRTWNSEKILENWIQCRLTISLVSKLVLDQSIGRLLDAKSVDVKHLGAIVIAPVAGALQRGQRLFGVNRAVPRVTETESNPFNDGISVTGDNIIHSL